MGSREEDIEADIKGVKDRGETVSSMEPLLIEEGSEHRSALTDLALDLAQKTAGFRRSLPESLFGLPRRSRACDELLVQQSDRRPRYAPHRYRARPQE